MRTSEFLREGGRGRGADLREVASSWVVVGSAFAARSGVRGGEPEDVTDLGNGRMSMSALTFARFRPLIVASGVEGPGAFLNRCTLRVCGTGALGVSTRGEAGSGVWESACCIGRSGVLGQILIPLGVPGDLRDVSSEGGVIGLSSLAVAGSTFDIGKGV